MKRRVASWFVASCGVLALAAVGGACSDDDGEPTDPCGEPGYGGKASDEAWHVIVDAYDHAEVGAAEAVTVTSPTADQVIDASGAAPVFAWTEPEASATPRGHGAGPADVRAALAGRSLLDVAGAFWSGPAAAHLPPITGDIYYVEVTVPGRECKLTYLTTETTWRPSVGDWQILKGATGALTFTITSAYLVENNITEGPYRPAAAVTFEVN